MDGLLIAILSTMAAGLGALTGFHFALAVKLGKVEQSVEGIYLNCERHDKAREADGEGETRLWEAVDGLRVQVGRMDERLQAVQRIIEKNAKT
jgi:hypothetical protein